MIEPAPLGFSGADRPAADAFNRCIRCGLCLPSCPTYLETLTETSGPRGRISLIRAVDEGRLGLLDGGFVGQMSECLDCRACEAACPSGVPYGALLEAARAQIRRARAPDERPRDRFARRAALALLARPALLRASAALLRFAQRTGLASLAAVAGMRNAVRLAPRIPNRFFTARGQRFDAAHPQGLAFLHVGCVMQVAFPNVHDATVRMLTRAGLSVTVPAGQGCCGALAVHAGEPDAGRDLARRNIEAFERSGADVYVSDAAGCGAALKEYGRLLAGDALWAERAQRFAARVRDVIEVLDAMPFDPPRGRIDAAVTYQDACHLAHAQRVTGAPRRLLAKIPGLRLVEMDESAVCCGSAGIYNLTNPEMASALQRRKSDNVVRTGARIVATANPGCAMQVSAGLRAAGYEARVAHVVELLDEAYGV
jgi:glycolate dehydrogenase iron-sulfur subunit